MVAKRIRATTGAKDKGLVPDLGDAPQYWTVTFLDNGQTAKILIRKNSMLLLHPSVRQKYYFNVNFEVPLCLD